MTAIVVGPRKWSGSRDAEGHREYKVRHLVRCAAADGPASAMLAIGLPIPGEVWFFGDDLDPWAWCTFQASAEPLTDKEPNELFEVEQTFTTKPRSRCQDFKVEDPLLEPPDINITFQKYQEEATADRFGVAIRNSAHELIRGPKVEFDANRITVKIKQNVPLHLLDTVNGMIDTVNGFPLWGLPTRNIKLSSASLERKFYGSCLVYWARTLEFEISEKFDRDILDEGTKVLHGHWANPAVTDLWVLDNLAGNPPNPKNPKHFDKMSDRKGNPMKVILNGRGLPSGVVVGGSNKVISIQAGNVNHPISDPDWWIPVLGSVTSGAAPATWDSDAVYYKRGSLVTYGGTPYVAVEDNYLLDDTFELPTNILSWEALAVNPTFIGDWSAATTYGSGEYVNAGAEEKEGKVHVEKYGESDFLLLGIPVLF